MRAWLIPAADWLLLRKAAGLSLAGALIAGLFGILHDEITFTLAPEYFTRMKFDQFRSADFGFSARVLRTDRISSDLIRVRSRISTNVLMLE